MSHFDLSSVLDRIVPVSTQKLATIQARIDRQAKPIGSLGRLEEFARRFVAITGREQVSGKRVYTFAGDHGVADILACTTMQSKRIMAAAITGFSRNDFAWIRHGGT